MQFLIDYGITEELISKLKEKYDPSVLDILRLDKTNVIEVLNYLKEIDIKIIEDLLLYKIEFFTKDLDEIKKAFNKHNIKQIVSDINDDITNINRI